MIDIFTDASCIPLAGVGGWAALIRYPYKPAIELSGTELCGRVNRMELLAAIKALATIPACEAATIWTDSQYVMRGSAQFKKEDANADLWKWLARVVDLEGNRIVLGYFYNKDLAVKARYEFLQEHPELLYK